MDMDEETVMRAAMIEREARQLEENLQLIDGQIAELESFEETLNFFIKSKDKEMLSSLGRRVYVRTNIEERDKLFVEVGSGVIVKKSPGDTIKIAKEQIERLRQARNEILSRLNEYNGQLQQIIDLIRNSEKTI